MRTRFADMNCSVAQALEILGDWWTLLVIREAFFGARRFADFAANLPIAKNILSDRLRRLVAHGILAKTDVGRRGSRHEYTLTEKGIDLLAVLTALRDWADRWVYGPGKEPLIVKDRRTDRRIARLCLTNAEGTPIGPFELSAEPGPGASRETLRRFGR